MPHTIARLTSNFRLTHQLCRQPPLRKEKLLADHPPATDGSEVDMRKVFTAAVLAGTLMACSLYVSDYPTRSTTDAGAGDGNRGYPDAGHLDAGLLDAGPCCGVDANPGGSGCDGGVPSDGGANGDGGVPSDGGADGGVPSDGGANGDGGVPNDGGVPDDGPCCGNPDGGNLDSGASADGHY
jgi:hypothetical protein